MYAEVIDAMPPGWGTLNKTQVLLTQFNVTILEQSHLSRISMQNIHWLLVFLWLLCLLHCCVGHLLGEKLHHALQSFKHLGLPGKLLLAYQIQNAPGAKHAKAFVAVVGI